MPRSHTWQEAEPGFEPRFQGLQVVFSFHCAVSLNDDDGHCIPLHTAPSPKAGLFKSVYLRKAGGPGQYAASCEGQTGLHPGLSRLLSLDSLCTYTCLTASDSTQGLAHKRGSVN